MRASVDDVQEFCSVSCVFLFRFNLQSHHLTQFIRRSLTAQIPSRRCDQVATTMCVRLEFSSQSAEQAARSFNL